MNRKEILEMPAGREMDALIAEKVIGWRIDELTAYSPSGSSCARHPKGDWWLNYYSTNMDAAWEIVEKFVSKGYGVHVYRHGDWNDKNGKRYWQSYMDFRFPIVDADTAPLAICRAALLAVMDASSG